MSDQGKPEVVVVTGSSRGVGRAIAHAFAKRGARVALLARGQDGLDGAKGEVEALGGRALAIPTDVTDHAAVEEAAARVEDELGAHRHLGQRRDGDRVRPLYRHRARGVQACHRGHLPRRGLRDDGRAEADGPPRSRQDRPGGLGALLPGDPSAGRLLRREVRDPRVHRLDPHRAARRPQQGAADHGAAARGELHAVQLVSLQAAKHPMPVPPIYQLEIPAEAVYWAAHHRPLWVGYSAVQAIIGTTIAPNLADWYLAKTGIKGQQVQDMPVAPGRPDNLYAPVQDLAATHGMFDAQAKTRSPQLWGSHPPSARRRRGGRGRGGGRHSGDETGAMSPAASPADAVGAQRPAVLRDYALLADGQRGILVGPRGDLAWMCFPSWDSDAVFSSLIGGAAYPRAGLRGMATVRRSRSLPRGHDGVPHEACCTGSFRRRWTPTAQSLIGALVGRLGLFFGDELAELGLLLVTGGFSRRSAALARSA